MKKDRFGRFINPYQKRIYRGFKDFLLWRVGYFNERSPRSPLPSDFCYPNRPEEIDCTKPQVTWINHSSYWVKAEGRSLLLDPVWSERCSPVPFLGPKRRHLPSPEIEGIDALDFVVLSHNHYDHLDFKSLNFLYKKFPQVTFVVPKGLKRWVERKFRGAKVIELGWWEHAMSEEICFTAVPAQHFSGRGLFDRNRTLWMGCIIDFPKAKRLYFAGDTGYNAIDFQQIGERFSGIDLSLIPIGVYAPRKFMKPVHIGPHESVQIHQEVGSKLSIGGHWGTFHLSSEEMERPPYDLYLALERAGVHPSAFRVLNPGQSINW